MRRASLALGAALFAAGCATDRVTLLDNESGSETGALAVLASDGRESVIDQPLTQAKLRDGPTRARPVKAIKPAYATLLANLPPAAKGFVVTFPPGQSAIPVEQRGILEAIRTELSIRPGAQIEVAGFTDSTGDGALNDEVSRKRAEAVAQELRDFGFNVDAGDAVGRGEDEAKQQLGDEVASEAYRRVEVIVR
ncbi:MAG: OmpA family protein [Novosphingobium sp.]|nr:OmpA family protein [Novosphingobium sp.]